MQTKVHVFNVLMLKTVLKWDCLDFVSRVSFCHKVRSLSPCAVSYLTCVLSYDTASHNLQRVCKHSAKTVKQNFRSACGPQDLVSLM